MMGLWYNCLRMHGVRWFWVVWFVAIRTLGERAVLHQCSVSNIVRVVHR